MLQSGIRTITTAEKLSIYYVKQTINVQAKVSPADLNAFLPEECLQNCIVINSPYAIPAQAENYY